MIIPLRTDRPLGRPSLVTPALVAINILVFILGILHQRADPDGFEALTNRLALDPANPEPWAFITYAFLHAGFLHLAGNILFLWIFGQNVEDRFGRLGFLAFYLAGAIAAGGLHVLFERSPVIGASGAISAVTGAYLVLFPRTVVRVFLIFFFIGVFAIPAWVLITMAIFWDFFNQGLGVRDGTARLAHLGGYALGISISLTLLWTRLLAREPYDLFTFLKQAARRRQFREALAPRRPAPAVNAKGSGDGEELHIVDGEIPRLRAEIATSFGRDDLDRGAELYRTLLERFPGAPGAAILSPRHQLSLANHLFKTEHFATAATAYTAFLEGYPRDSESPGIKLLLGLIQARHLGNPDLARSLIADALPGLRDDDQRRLAESLLAELGPSRTAH